MSDRQSVLVHRPGMDPVDVRVGASATILDLLRDSGIQGADSPCGGEGTCGKCVLRVGAADSEPRYALACRTPVHAASEVWLEEARELEIQSDFRSPSGRSWTADEPLPGHTVAIDIGTTTIATALLAPGGAEVLARASDRNRQTAYGADVISRIAKSNAAGGPDDLTAILRGQLADLVSYLLDSAGVDAGDVSWYAIAGNTVMGHYVTGLSPASIAVAPFEPLSLFADVHSAAALGLPGGDHASVYMLPAVAGYIGGDISAGALACELDRAEGVTCLLDLGTNGEILLSTPRGMVACATAAGPAFEGAQIECGMPAVAGAIDRVTAGAGQLRIRTILDAVPIGICGSGLVDALAAALKLGLVDETGRLLAREEVRPALAEYLTPKGEVPRLLLTEDGSVYLSQRDIRQLQLAKGAIAAGLDVVLADAGLTWDDVDRVLLAGGFGTKVRARSLVAIGMFPESLVRKTVAVGNAALAGTCRAAADQGSRRDVLRLARECTYLELSLDPRFTDAFMDRMTFDPAPVPDLPRALRVAGQFGFEAVHELAPATLQPMAEVRGMCASDLCRSYGRNWACPPACGSLDEFGLQLGSYSRGMLVQTVGRLEDQFDGEGMAAAEKLHKRRLRRLTDALAGSFPRELPLGVGPCDVCATCTYPAEPCRLPGLRVVSMEAAGLLVTKVCELNGAAYYHGPLTVTYTSCLLLD